MTEQRILAGSDPRVDAFAQRWVNLADAQIGAEVVFATDDFFAPAPRMLSPEPAVFIPDKFDDHGKWMDGWETRRRRTLGHDFCVVRLATPGTICALDIDTSHFTGNFPPAASVEGCFSERDPDDTTAWTSIVPSHSLTGNAHHPIELEAPTDQVFTHLRLHIYPDGGVARLRAFGQPHCDWTARDPDTLYELSALLDGGRAVAWSDAHYGNPSRILTPGRGLNMGDGWETRRRREPGNDWMIVALAHPGTVAKVEVDTAHFKGNYPDSCSLQACLVEGGTDESLITQSMFWDTLLPQQKLQMDHNHLFEGAQLEALGPVSHIRFNIHPDGGISRLRVFGYIAEAMMP